MHSGTEVLRIISITKQLLSPHRYEPTFSSSHRSRPSRRYPNVIGISDFDTSDEEFPIRSTPRSVACGRGVHFAATPSYREVTPAATSSRRPGEIRAAGYRHTPLRVGSSPSLSESEVEKKGKLKGKKIRDDNAPKNPQNPPSNNESSDDVRIKIVETNSEGEELTLLERKVEGERQEVPAGSSAEAPKSKRGSQLPALESSISTPDIPHRSSAQPPVPPSSSTSMTPRAVPLDLDLPPHLPQESSSSRLENQDESKIEGDRGDESDEQMKRWKEKGKWKAGESSTPPGGSGSRDTSWRRSSRANAAGLDQHLRLYPPLVSQLTQQDVAKILISRIRLEVLAVEDQAHHFRLVQVQYLENRIVWKIMWQVAHCLRDLTWTPPPGSSPPDGSPPGSSPLSSKGDDDGEHGDSDPRSTRVSSPMDGSLLFRLVGEIGGRPTPQDLHPAQFYSELGCLRSTAVTLRGAGYAFNVVTKLDRLENSLDSKTARIGVGCEGFGRDLAGTVASKDLAAKHPTIPPSVLLKTCPNRRSLSNPTTNAVFAPRPPNYEALPANAITTPGLLFERVGDERSGSIASSEHVCWSGIVYNRPNLRPRWLRIMKVAVLNAQSPQSEGFGTLGPRKRRRIRNQPLQGTNVHTLRSQAGTPARPFVLP
ncbi:hypothetical protein PM082_000324 [Marasmius tenuissimus]|nr:hypothetical protein PM082_000324 [Marasmius tenuissimus]